MDDHRLEFEVWIGTDGDGAGRRVRMTAPHGFVRVVAVETLRREVASFGAVARLQEEARLRAAVEHHAVPTVHDLGWVEGWVALVSEHVGGADLAEWVEACRGLGPVVPMR